MLEVLIILGIVVDRITKILASNYLSLGKTIEVIPNLFDFQYLENTGAAFGIFKDKAYILAIFSIIVIIGLIIYIFKFSSKKILERIAISLIISGAIGNLFDRFYFNYVIDFIYLHYNGYSFPVFNVADILVSVGTALLAIYLVKEVK